MWRATWKSLAARKVRLLLTGIAIVLGVGFVAGTYVLTDTLNAAFTDLFTQTTRGVDVQVEGVQSFSTEGAGPGGGGGSERQPVPDSLVPEIEALPGVKQVVGGVQGYAQLVDPSTGKAITTGGAPTIGTSWTPLAGLNLTAGAAPTALDEVAVDAGTAQTYDLRVGQTIHILLEGPARDFTISGIVQIGGTDSLLGATLAVFDVPTAQDVLNRQGFFDYISVVADDGVSPASLRDSITQILPKGYEAITGDTAARRAADEVSQGLGFLQTFLLVFAMVSLFVGAFIIFNTFNIIVTQRVRELGLLRTLGASRRQILRSVVIEAFLTGLVASAVGVVAGIGIAIGLQALMRLVGLDLPSTATRLLPRTIIVSMVLGTVVTMAASIAPARRAARVAPIEALRETSTPPSSTPRRRSITGGIISALGVLELAIGLFGHGSNRAPQVGLGAALTFVGVAVLSPLFTRPLASWIGSPFGNRTISRKLGRENAMRNPRRTASTAAALMIGLGLVTFVSVAAASLKASASDAIDKALKADFIVNGSGFSPFSPQAVADLTADPAFGAVAEVRQGQVKVDGSAVFVSATSPTIGQVLNLPFDTGGLQSLADPETILVSSKVATDHGLTVGDTVEVEFASTGEQTFTVGGVYSDDSVLGSYVIPLAAFEKNFAQQLDMSAFASLAPSATGAEGRAAVDRLMTAYPNIQVQD